MNKQNIIVVLTQVLFITALFNLPFLAQAHHTPIASNVAKDPTDLPLLPQGNGLVTINLQIQEVLPKLPSLKITRANRRKPWFGPLMGLYLGR